MIIIGIAGGTGSGKTTFVRRLIGKLPEENVTVISQDAYYHDNSHINLEERRKKNYDHPEAIDWQLLIDHLQQLKNNFPIQQPIYSMLTCTREDKTNTVYPNKVIIVEGILLLTNEKLRDHFSLKIFIDADSDHRLMRVVKRDMEERGRDVDEVMQRYLHSVRPMHEQYIEPSKKFADVIIPIGGDNHVAIELLSQYILRQL
ncbi:MAG: uridine kinase [Chitinophagales bacterium]